MNRVSCFFLSLFCLSIYWPTDAEAFEPELPSAARLTAERVSALDSFKAPIANFDGSTVPSVFVEGRVSRKSWRIDLPGLTTLQVIMPLRLQLEAEGYDLSFECDAADCGGFDFRFDTEVLPGPNMFVNISRYRYLTAVKGNQDAPSDVVGILASVTAGAAYVQVIHARKDTAQYEIATKPDEKPVVDLAKPQTNADGLEEALFSQGHVILEDLEFATGSTDLGTGPFTSLAQLAVVLEERSGLRIALVGHTDTVGNLDTNVAVSRARAASVRDRLISEFGIAAERLDAEGMGYLAPIASNLTEDGRTRNRRVEAVIVSEE